ncbi:MAG TPA: sigma-70 family RNA polymerase sigma factor, partial [Planctomycetota bacterium]
LGPDAGAADDAVQETWLAALHHAPLQSRSLGGWLRTVLVHAVARLRRGERRRLRHEDRAATRRGLAAEDHALVLEREELAAKLFAAVRELDAAYRDVIWQRYFEGKAPRAIAAASGVPIATVKSRLQRGLGLLRARFAEGGGDRGDWRGAFAAAFGLGQAGTATALTGGVLMATWTKAIGVAAAVLLAAAVWWWPDAGMAPPSQAGGAGLPAIVAAASQPEPATREQVESAPVVRPRPSVAPAPDAPPSPGLVEGRAVDAATGAPLADVRVSVQPREVGEVTAEVATAHDGTFVLPARVGRCTGIVLRRADRATVEWFDDVAAGEHLAIGDLPMRRGRALPGRLVDPAGGPIPDKVFVSIDYEARFADGWRERRGEVRTDAAGGFVTSEPLPIGARTKWTLPFGGVDLPEPVTVLIGDEEPKQIVLTVRQRPRIRGVVVDEAGQSVTGGVQLGEQPMAGLASVAKDGTFTLLMMRPGAATNVYVVHAPEFESLPPIHDVPWGTENLRIALQRTRPFLIEVVGPDGAPIVDFGIALQRPGMWMAAGRVQQRGAHEGGRLAATGVVRGETTVRIVPMQPHWRPSEPIAIGNEEPLRVVLDRRSSVDVVVRRNELPVADAFVELVRERGASLRPDAPAQPDPTTAESVVMEMPGCELVGAGRTDERGRVAVWRDRELAGCVLRVTVASEPAHVQRELAVAERRPLVVDLPVFGRLLANVELRGCHRDRVRLEIPGTAHTGSHALVPGRDGRFAPVVLPVGDHCVQLQRRLGVMRTLASAEVEITAGQAARVSFDLGDHPLCGARGSVTAAGPLPADLVVDLLHADPGHALRVLASANVAADGSFAVSDLLPGTYRAALRRGIAAPHATPAIEPAEFEVGAAGGAAIALRYAPRRLVVRMQRPDGSAVRGERVLARCGGASWPSMRLVAPMVDEKLVLDPAPALPVEFREWTDGSPWSEPVVMPPDRVEAEVTVVLPARR